MVVGLLLSRTSYVMSNHISAIAHVTMEQVAPIQSEISEEVLPKIGQNLREASILLCVGGCAARLSSS